MICAIAELESDRQLLVMNTGHKSKEPTVGLMQLLPKTAEWLMRYWLLDVDISYFMYQREVNILYFIVI